MRIAIIADTHFSQDCEMTCGKRHTGRGCSLLGQAVSRLNRVLKPDLTVLLGDLIDNGSGPAAEEELRLLLEQTQCSDSRILALPGNHDGDLLGRDGLGRLNAGSLAKRCSGIRNSFHLTRVCIDDGETSTTTKPRIERRLQRTCHGANGDFHCAPPAGITSSRERMATSSASRALARS